MTWKQAYMKLYSVMRKWQNDDRKSRSQIQGHSLGQDYSLSRCVNLARTILREIDTDGDVE